VALDFETTGLDLRKDAVVSFGLVPVRAGRIVLEDAVYREVAPEVPPSPTSITIHELRPIDLASAPPLREVRPELAEALRGRFVLAWVAEVEVAFLARVFGTSRRRWARRTIDVKRLAEAEDRLRGVSPDRRSTLAAAARRFGVPVERTHHAFDDALMTAELFLVLATRLAARGAGGGTVAGLLREGRPRRGRS